MILSLLLLSAVTGQVPAERCLSEYGSTKCGYDCVAAYGEIKCARTPLGVCKSSYGQIRCWDPQPSVVAAYGHRAQPAQCIANYGEIACGWSCVANYGQLKCAQTPAGVCVANAGQLHCEDPQLEYEAPRRERRPQDPLPQAQCLSEYGKTVCGYGCVANYGQIRCSAVPGGVCAAAYGKITCSQ